MSFNLLSKVSIYQNSLVNQFKLQCFNLSFKLRRNFTGNASNFIKSNMNNSNLAKQFCFTNYDCIGFDLDNTICKYKVGPMIKMEYEAISTYLVKNKNYPSHHLFRPIEQNLDFLQKGLIIDFVNGNILKINKTGKITHASHGTRHMTEDEIMKQYGENMRWKVTDIFSQDLLATWNGPLSEQMRSLLDYFDMPVGLAFARAVDTLDEKAGKKLDKYSLWPDLLAALTDMFDVQHFELNRGGYFPLMKAEPDRYIEKCSDNLMKWLKALKERNKILFLITGSYVDFASLTSSTCMGKNWYELFDIIIFHAKKPGFFTQNRPFLSLDGKEQICGTKLQRGNWYLQGNWKSLHSCLANISNKTNPKIAYVGDNLIQDVYTPDVYTHCDTVAVVEELHAEGVFGHDNQHDDKHYLASECWGSFFSSEHNDNIWLNIIHQHSKLCVPNMDYVAAKPVDHVYST